MNKKCKRCGKLFLITELEKRFCSEICRNLYMQVQRKYYLSNKGQISAKKYRFSEKGRISRRRAKKKELQKISNKILHYCRIRINKAIKNICKSAHTMELIGCSIDFLKKHLESQFVVGMSWENYGKWHIDHIRPCAGFNFSIPEEQRKCFHYSNLQPLWALENSIKSDH